MNKKYAAYFTECGMTVNGNRAYGIVSGYEVNVLYQALDTVSPVLLYISCYTTDEQKRAIEAEIRNAAIKFCKTTFSAYGLIVGLNGMTASGLLKRLPDLFNLFFEILGRNGALHSGFCPVCGNELTEENAKKCTVIDGITVTLDGDCVNSINSVITAENVEYEQAPNNYGRGFAGALIGGLVGALIAAALYAVGFIAAISSFVSIVLGTFLYGKFGGKKNKMMVVIVSVTTVVFMLVSVVAIYIIATGLALVGTDAEMGAVEAFVTLMRTEPQFAIGFWGDIILTLVFTALGIGYEIFVLLKKVKRPTQIR